MRRSDYLCLVGIFLILVTVIAISGCKTIDGIVEIFPTLSPANTPTPLPAPTRTCPPCGTPTAEPIPTPTNPPSSQYTMTVRVTNIPIMTDENKDDYNKQCLFCVHNESRTRYVAIFHRYLWRHHAWNPIPGNAPWWATWRMESGYDCFPGLPPDDCGEFEEWHIFGSQPLPGDTATFLIDWSPNVGGVSVTLLSTPHLSQHLDFPGPFLILSEDAGCDPWGWHSPANAEKID